MKNSSSTSFIALSKERNDRWVLSLSFDQFGQVLTWPLRAVWGLLMRFISWLAKWDFPSAKVSFSVASMGLAIGLIISVAGQVLIRPTTTLAVPSLYTEERTGPRVAHLKIPAHEVTLTATLSESTEGYFQLPRDTVTHFQFSGRPQESKPIFMGVGYYSVAQDLLSDINLGEELAVVGDNNGLYRYRVVATQLRPADQLNASDQLDAELIIAVPQDLFNREFLLVLAN